MPPPDPVPGSPKDWLARAKGKLALAKQPLPTDGYLEDLCFFAQQAAELAIKGVYQKNGWAFPFIHNIGKLLDGLEQQGMAVPADVQDADQLTVFAAQTRYPGTYTLVSWGEYQEAIRIAEAVVVWAEALLS